MASSDSGNAMTEIALALAMAFFAIMILTMVSMGSHGTVEQVAQAAAVSRQEARLLNDRLHLQASANEESTSARVLQPSQIIIFSDGRFLDVKLQPLDAGTIAAMAQPVLAVPPKLSLAEVMAAKARLDRADLTVTTLNRRWLEVLKEHEK